MLTHLAFLVSVVIYVVVGHVVHLPGNHALVQGVPYLPFVMYAAFVVSLPVVAVVGMALPQARARAALALASYETGAVYGLVLTLLGFPPYHQWILSAASFLLIGFSLLRNAAALP